MTDLAAAAPVAPEGNAAPAETPVAPPQPIESAGPERKAAEPPKAPEKAPERREKPSVADSLKKADAKAREQADAKGKQPPAKADAAKPEAKPAEKAQVKSEGPQRDETGRFQPREGAEPKAAEPAAKDSPYREAPSRFKSDPAALAEWDKAGEPLKAATHRVMREMEQGIQKYKPDAEAYAEIKEYSDLAKKHGTTVKRALDNYVGLERMLAKDPIGGLEKVVSNLGLKTREGQPITLRDIAGYILGQKPEHVASRQDAVIQGLNRKIEALEKQVGGVSSHIEQQNTAQIERTVTSFAEKHPRVEELAADIEFFLKSDKVDKNLPPQERLSEAYRLADRLNPAPAAFTARAQTPSADPEAQTLKGSKSVSGAPSSGSDPASRKPPSSSIREALRRAAASAA